MKKKIAIIKFPNSNIQSVISSLNYLGFQPEVIQDGKKLKNYGNLVIPGVGAFKAGMNFLKEKQLDKEILKFVLSGKNTLVVCLGMQIFLESSEEFGITKGLSLIKGKVKRFNQVTTNLGWKQIYLNKDKFKNNFFYFVHSYYCDLTEKNIIHSYSFNNKFKFCSSYLKNNILGCQFHPEKSGKTGLKLIKNFFDGKNIKTL